MHEIVMLGAHGGRSTGATTTCLQVSPHCVIDAGNIIAPLGARAGEIDHVFLSHSHLDHLIDIPFLVDAFFGQRRHRLRVYGSSSTLESLKRHVLNGDIWPEFQEFKLVSSEERAIEFITITDGECFTIDGVTLCAVEMNHTIDCFGYLLKREEGSILFTSDTYCCPRIWQILSEDASIHSLIIDVSFPSAFEKLAHDSRHLTPRLLKGELEALNRPVAIYPFHLKPAYRDQLIKEIHAHGLLAHGGKVLEDGDRIQF